METTAEKTITRDEILKAEAEISAKLSFNHACPDTHGACRIKDTEINSAQDEYNEYMTSSTERLSNSKCVEQLETRFTKREISFMLLTIMRRR